jgi:hypothetical protein
MNSQGTVSHNSILGEHHSQVNKGKRNQKRTCNRKRKVLVSESKPVMVDLLINRAGMRSKPRLIQETPMLADL